jgi:saccharopine dehydrogenase-like NADP-dependent oxidoreductase
VYFGGTPKYRARSQYEIKVQAQILPIRVVWINQTTHLIPRNLQSFTNNAGAICAYVRVLGVQSGKLAQYLRNPLLLLRRYC